MDGGLAFFLLAIVFVIGFMVVMTPVVVLVNRAIGSGYDARAQQLAPYWQAEGLRFAEDEVKTRSTWIAPLAVGVRWPNMDVRVTSRAIYLVQSRRMFGMRIGQPILAIPQPGAALDPAIAHLVTLAWLKVPPRWENVGVVLEGGLGAQRFTMRLMLRDPRTFLAATGG
jgi:hypothetical protein